MHRYLYLPLQKMVPIESFSLLLNKHDFVLLSLTLSTRGLQHTNIPVGLLLTEYTYLPRYRFQTRVHGRRKRGNGGTRLPSRDISEGRPRQK